MLIERRQQPVFDPENINWTEPTTFSDDEIEVKEIDNKPKALIARRPAFGQTDNSQYDDIVRHFFLFVGDTTKYRTVAQTFRFLE